MKKRKRSAITKAKMLQGIHDILIEEGCGKINVAYVSTYSGVDRKLLYYHFGSFSNMVAEFLQLDAGQFDEKPIDPWDKQAMAKYLKQRMDQLFDNPILKQLLVWELSDNIPALKYYASKREQNETQFIQHQLEMRNGSERQIDIQAIFALLLGGIHYLSAYSQQNNKPFFGMNYNDETQRKHLLDILARVLSQIT